MWCTSTCVSVFVNAAASMLLHKSQQQHLVVVACRIVSTRLAVLKECDDGSLTQSRAYEPKKSNTLLIIRPLRTIQHYRERPGSLESRTVQTQKSFEHSKLIDYSRQSRVDFRINSKVYSFRIFEF
ncbi:hypothetical protein Y032_0867g2772 [Ancylostoma ceylanicum]|uniref:Uncharacterized protein n=1 Tax=Ancylostoma ceylanicum TaxID=53326 RepID=A0A016WA21_9BILA|nr:hypothetical protein Y032_0867g2772 [Ancylostoma ceylanicum]